MADAAGPPMQSLPRAAPELRGWVVAAAPGAKVEGTTQGLQPGTAVHSGDVLVTETGATVVVRLIEGGGFALGSDGRALLAPPVRTPAGIDWPSVVVLAGPAAFAGAEDAEEGVPFLLVTTPDGLLEVAGGPVLRVPGGVLLDATAEAGRDEVHVVAGAFRWPLVEPGSAVEVAATGLRPAVPESVDPGALALLAQLRVAFDPAHPVVAAARAASELARIDPAAGPTADGTGLEELLDQLTPEAARERGAADGTAPTAPTLLLPRTETLPSTGDEAALRLERDAPPPGHTAVPDPLLDQAVAMMLDLG